MNTFLQQLDNAGVPLQMTTANDTAGDGVCALPDIGFAAIDGPDALKFLQGQATCDSSALSVRRAGPGAFCNLKGRIYSNFLATLRADNLLLLRMSDDIVDATVSNLGKYIVFSKAEITNAGDRFVALGLFGDRASAIVESNFGAAPLAVNDSVSNEIGVAIRRETGAAMYECWIEIDRAPAFWHAVSAELPVVAPAEWRLREIRQGIGQVCAATVDEFLPQMLNLQAIDGVSFTKGCYTGQEVVARMQYRGKVKRRLFRASAATAAPLPGTAIVDADNKACGHIVQAVNTGTDRCEVLAVIAIAAADDAHCADATPLQIEALPYSLADN